MLKHMITLQPGLFKAAVSSDHKRKPGKRGACRGWSLGAARRNRDFLGSIIPEELTGHALAVSLTVRDCPGTSQEWHECREALLQRLRRKGLIRFHWVTEWQMRRSANVSHPCPHLHGIFFFSEPADAMARAVTRDWLEVTRAYGSSVRGQHASGVPKVAGWLQYLSKHGSRGVFNDQRTLGVMPDDWLTAGRLWGKGGTWPVRSQRVDLDARLWFQLRRLALRHDRAQARSAFDKAKATGKAERIKAARRSLSSSRENLKRKVAYRLQDLPRPVHKGILRQTSENTAVACFLPDFAVDRWLQTLPPELWAYREEEGKEPPPVVQTPYIGTEGGGGV